MKVVKFEEIELHIDESNTLSTKEVAQGYGISPSVVRTHKSLHSDELIENVHYILKRDDRNRLVTRWTLEGVHMLGFFIKSERAKEFRKFTAKLLTEIKKGNVQVSVAPPQNCPAADNMSTRIAGYKGMLARKNKEIERLRFELIQAQEKVKELEKHSLHDKIFFDTNSIDLAGGIARHNIMLNAAADHLEMIAKDLRERASHTQYFLDNLLKFFPKAKDTVEKVKKYYRRIYPPYIT